MKLQNKLVACLALLSFGLATSGCLSSTDKARQTVTAAVRVMIDGAEAVNAADDAEKKDLLSKVDAGSMTLDQAQKAYEDWTAKRGKISQAIGALWDALKGACKVIDAVDAKQSGDLAGALSDVTGALLQVEQALADAGIKLPGVK